jgi:hypothetical protein
MLLDRCLRILCRGNVCTESLPSNEHLFWFQYSGFWASCQNILWPSSYSRWVNFDFSSRRRVRLYLCNLMCTSKQTNTHSSLCAERERDMLESRRHNSLGQKWHQLWVRRKTARRNICRHSTALQRWRFSSSDWPNIFFNPWDAGHRWEVTVGWVDG